MEILDSLEVRWFFGSTAPVVARARSWFAHVSAEPRRRDEYLLTDRADVGFKARVIEAEPIKLETKYRLETTEAVQLAPNVTGHVERWRKLSVALDDPELKKAGTWRGLDKVRWLRRFTFEGGVVREAPPKARLALGCGLELTELRWQAASGAEGGVAWTLALEAFGHGAPLLEVLRGTLRAATETGLELALESRESMGYPEWLQRSAS